MTSQVERRRSSGGYWSLLRDRSFSPYFVGESVSSIGDAMSEVTIVLVAMSLVSPEVEGRALAAATIAYLLPGVLTGTLLGRWLRRLSPHGLLLLDSLWRFGWFALIGLLHSQDALSLPALLVCLGAAALTKPAGLAGGRAIIPVLVPPDRHLHANSLVSLVVQGAMMVGPAVAGLVASIWTPVTALVVDGISFLALTAGVLISIRVSAPTAPPAEDDVVEGGGRPTSVQTTSTRTTSTRTRSDLLRISLPVFATTGFFHLLYGGFVVSLPLLANARSPEDGGAALLGVMWSFFGIGAVSSGVLAPRFPALVRPAALPLMAVGWGVCMCVIAVLPQPSVMTLAMLFGGLAYGPYTAVVSTMLQRDLPAPDMIEVSGYYGVLTTAASPLGIMLAGLVVSAVTPDVVMGVAGAGLVGAASVYTAVLWRRTGLDGGSLSDA